MALVIPSTNVKVDEPPVHYSNQIVEKEGKDYFYEEATVRINFYLDTQPANSNAYDCFFVKQGRMVTMSCPRIENGTPGSNASIVCDSNSIPERFRPAPDNRNDGNIDQLYKLVPTRQEGGPLNGDGAGRCIISKDGSMRLARDAAGNPFETGVGVVSYNIYPFSLHWLAQSAYNTPYVEIIPPP